jgi:hypothetical protein
MVPLLLAGLSGEDYQNISKEGSCGSIRICIRVKDDSAFSESTESLQVVFLVFRTKITEVQQKYA